MRGSQQIFEFLIPFEGFLNVSYFIERAIDIAKGYNESTYEFIKKLGLDKAQGIGSKPLEIDNLLTTNAPGFYQTG